MSTQAVAYCTSKKLNCCPPAQVILCVSPSLTVSGKASIEATLSLAMPYGSSCGGCTYQYTFEYDDSQLLDQSAPLTTAAINGVICRDCFSIWVEESLSVGLTGWGTDEIGNFIQSDGSTGDIIFDDTDALIRQNTFDGADNKSLSLAGGGAADNLQGAYIKLYGNEAGAGNAGDIYLSAGNIAGSAVNITLGDVVFAQTSPVIHTDAATKLISIAGGVSASDASGAFISVFGNTQAGQPGEIDLNTGNVANADINYRINNATGAHRFSVNGTEQLYVTAAGIVFQQAQSGIQLQSGANGRTGTFSLNGTTPVVISNTSLTANDVIELHLDIPVGAFTLWALSARTDGVGFSVVTGAGHTSQMRYILTRVN